MTNEKCKELVFIMEGKGKVVVEGKEVELNKEDIILIEAGERFYWEGEMKMFVTCNPAWYSGQHKELE